MMHVFECMKGGTTTYWYWIMKHAFWSTTHSMAKLYVDLILEQGQQAPNMWKWRQCLWSGPIILASYFDNDDKQTFTMRETQQMEFVKNVHVIHINML